MLYAGTDQAIFHVEHSARGMEDRPLNEWRIVHVTEDARLLKALDRIAADPWLPEYIEIYIRDVLDVRIARRPAA